MYSVVMATRPGEPFILEALASIYDQTLPPQRVLVVVNGPGAIGGPLPGTIRDRFPAVEIHTLAAPSMPGALAHGIPLVETEFVAVLDSDDLWALRKQELQVERLMRDPHLDAVGCTVVNFQVGQDGTPVEELAVPGRLFSAMTFRRDVFERFGLPDRDADHFAWLVRWWASAQAAGIVTEALAYPGLRRRVHATNGWVVDRDHGHATLLGELRRIERSRRTGRGEVTSA